MGFGAISTDLYLPAMPTIGQALKADAGSIELTISGFLVGFSVGQLIWGPISDKYGRRVPIAAGIALFILGSAGCAMAQSASAMIAWRIVQAVGACAGVALGRAMVRDLYEGARAARMLSILITVMSIAPLLGPLLGGQILATAGWRAIFWLLVAVGFGTLVLVATLPETLPERNRNRDLLVRALVRYGELLGRQRLLGYAGVGAFFYAGAFAFIAGSPFAYITYHQVPASLYGALFGLAILGIMALNMLNVRLVTRIGSDRLLRLGAAIAAASGLVVAISSRTDAGGLWGLVVPLFVFISLNGLIVANSITGAMADFPQRAGAVSALVGAIHYGSGMIGSAFVGWFADGTPWPMGLVIAISGVGCFACTLLVRGADKRT
jgi:DHA1 family bicyclomycin/chloramphenicol resistance-like MFS transporter